MRQVVQSLKNGQRSLTAVPQPLARPGTVLIANAFSLISAGTEKTAMELAQKSLLGKARERPDHVRRVLEKVRNEGLLNTVAQVRARLDEPMTMGYSSSGTVLAVGAGVEELKPGDRVASNGPHAEVVCVPRRLCASVPEGVALDHAAFAGTGGHRASGRPTRETGNRFYGAGRRPGTHWSDHHRASQEFRRPGHWHGPGRDQV